MLGSLQVTWQPLNVRKWNDLGGRVWKICPKVKMSAGELSGEKPREVCGEKGPEANYPKPKWTRKKFPQEICSLTKCSKRLWSETKCTRAKCPRKKCPYVKCPKANCPLGNGCLCYIVKPKFICEFCDDMCVALQQLALTGGQLT